MKNKLFLSQDFLRDMIEQLQIFVNSPEKILLRFNEDEIIMEEDLAVMLGVNVRTIRNYRKENEIKALHFCGRVIYLRTFLYLDLLTRYYRLYD